MLNRAVQWATIGVWTNFLSRLSPNPHLPLAMFSGVAFALGGLALYLAA
jgi:hypothetical protein